ncbi:glycosyltransferase [Rhizobium sp. GN54]|nr:glycosyltransferase [Rhizobium sp. GN54]
MARKRLGLPQDKKVIAYVPSFSSDVKGYREIVAAFRKIKQMKPRFEPIVLLVGNGPASDDDICFKKKRLGYIADNHELAVAYAAADVVVVPSLEETFSNTTAEAISCGVPVVGFKTGAIPEMAVEGRSGVTCAVGNVDALARGILKVLSGPDLSKSCREYAVAELSLMRQARRYEALFQELAAAKRQNQDGRPARVYGQGLSAHDLFKRSIEVHGKK